MQNANAAFSACTFFLSLLLTPASPQCRVATADECRKSPGFIPGHGLASQGFDIASLEHTQFDVLDLSEWQKPDGSCTLCENPLLAGKPLQRLPLGITNWKANIVCQQEVQHSIAPSCISVAKFLTELVVRNDWKKELDVEMDSSSYTPVALEGTVSKWVSFCKQKIEEDKYIFLLHQAFCSYYKFHVSKNASASEKFKNDVKILPEKYFSSSKQSYHNLIHTYGTHFMTELDLGAGVLYLTAIQVCRMSLEDFILSEISRCLEIEVGVLMGFEELTKNPDFQKCKQKRTNLTFLSLISEYQKDLKGGATSHLDLSDQAYNFPESSSHWLGSVKPLPSLLSSSLEPLHTLLDKNDPRRKSLQQAVRDYVRERADLRDCTFLCPHERKHDVLDPCFCECPNNNFTNSMCCSQQRGLGKLKVTILRAEGLWGDFFTHSDGYVRVLLQKKEMCTPTVWNDDNPTWAVFLDFGIVKLTGDFTEVEIQVWDEDSGWDDDLLGRCLLTLKPWESSEHVCFLNHGRLHYKGHLICGYHLGGPSCMDYIPQRPEQKE